MKMDFINVSLLEKSTEFKQCGRIALRNHHVKVSLFEHWLFILILSEYSFVVGTTGLYDSDKNPISLSPHATHQVESYPPFPIFLSLGKMECWLLWEGNIFKQNMALFCNQIQSPNDFLSSKFLNATMMDFKRTHSQQRSLRARQLCCHF